jgi:hypothetical protein
MQRRGWVKIKTLCGGIGMTTKGFEIAQASSPPGQGNKPEIPGGRAGTWNTGQPDTRKVS